MSAYQAGMLKALLDIDANERENRKMGLEEKASDRADQYLGIAKNQDARAGEEFGWKRDAVAKENIIQAGMVEAANRGGYEGVINYLGTADPERAIKFHKEKLSLDENIMKNDVLAATSKNEITNAMFESYGILGKMGYALLKAAPEDRENMYKQILPMVKKINPNAPDTLNDDAVGMFMLGVAQSVPQNQFAFYMKESESAKSELGKIVQDYQTAVQQYGENSPQAKTLEQGMNNAVTVKDTATVKAQNLLSRNEDSLRKEWNQQTKSFKTIQDSYNGVIQASKETDSKQRGPQDMALIYNYMKMLDPNSVVLPGEYANAENAGSIPEKVRAQYNRVVDGGFLTPEVRTGFTTTAKSLFNVRKQSYDNMKGQYTDIALRRGYDVKNVLVESPTMEEMGNQQQPPQGQSDTITLRNKRTGESIQIPREQAIQQGLIKQ